MRGKKRCCPPKFADDLGRRNSTQGKGGNAKTSALIHLSPPSESPPTKSTQSTKPKVKSTNTVRKELPASTSETLSTESTKCTKAKKTFSRKKRKESLDVTRCLDTLEAILVEEKVPRKE